MPPVNLVFLAAGFEFVCVLPLIKVDPPFEAGAPPFFLSFCLLLSKSDILVCFLVYCNLQIFRRFALEFWPGRRGDEKD